MAQSGLVERARRTSAFGVKADTPRNGGTRPRVRTHKLNEKPE